MIRGLLIRPRTPGPHPVPIFNHGGVGPWGRVVLPDILAMNGLAGRGYIVLASAFRGEGGSEGRPEMGGGDVTYGALAKSRRIAAVVVEGGPTDLVHAARRPGFDRHVHPDALPGGRDAVLARRSPVMWPERLAPGAAILILHGGDPRVEPTDALRMATALQRRKRSYRLRIYQGGGHDLIADMAHVRAAMDRWSDRYVRDLTPPPANAAVPLADTP